MSRSPDQFEAGRQLLELQLAMMRGAMAFMADSAQRFVELSLGAATPPAEERGAPAQPAKAIATVPASRQRRQPPTALPAARRTRLAAAGKDYALRMQEDVDSILHAFAMVPDAADRLIRTSALLAEKPVKDTPPRARRSSKVTPARRPALREAAEHPR